MTPTLDDDSHLDPNALLPAQWAPTPHDAPERRFVRAIFVQALVDLTAAKPNIRRDALWWFTTPSASRSWICEVLGIPTAKLPSIAARNSSGFAAHRYYRGTISRAQVAAGHYRRRPPKEPRLA